MAFKSWLKQLIDPQGYGLAVIIALTLHLLVISLFAIQWPEEERQVAEPRPKTIQAKVIQTENKKVKQRKLEEQKRVAKRRNEALRKKQLAQKKAAQKKAAQQKAAKEAAKNKARKEQLAKDNAKKLAAQKNADKKKALALEQERLNQKKKDQQKKEQERKEQLAFEQAQEAALLEALAQEEQQRSMEKALAEEQRSTEEAAITDDIVAQIQAKIYQTWRYPPSARPQMTVLVSIQLVPTGEVINVSITKGSGNEAVDRSVLGAVKRAAPLPVPKDSRLFEQKFRNFSMEFSPKDAVW